MLREINIILDLYKQSYNNVKLKQSDTTKLTFNVLQNGVAANLSGHSFVLNFLKSDNTVVIQNTNFDTTNITSGIVKVTLVEDCVRVAGESKIELQIKKDGNLISNFSIDAVVESNLLNATSSQNKNTILDDLLAAIDEGVLTKAELDAWVTAHGDIANLDTRMDAAESSLAENMQHFINVKQLPAPCVSAKGDGITDDTVAIQQAINNFKTVFFPLGTYLVSDTIRESSNGGERRLIGENQFATIIKSKSTMTNKPIFWFGNSTGHGNYRGHIESLTFDGSSKAQNNIGIRWHECGTSIVRDVFIINCGMAIQGLGCIHSSVEGNTYIQDCIEGIKFTKTPIGVPSSLDDITVTASPLTLNTNMTKIRNVWLTAIEKTAVRIEGGMFELKGSTFQSCTTDGISDVVSVFNANEAYDYGGGVKVEDNWFEGGLYKYAIAVRGTRGSCVNHNFISGSESPNAEKEGGILISSSENTTAQDNSIRGYFSRTPSEGRLANAGVYVTQNSNLYKCNIDNNHFTKATVNYYFEGVPSPTIGKPLQPHWAKVSISGGVATVENASSKFIASITRVGVGLYSVAYTFNREVSSNGYATFGNALTNGSACSMMIYEQNVVADKFAFRDGSGTYIDPLGFTLQMYADWQAV